VGISAFLIFISTLTALALSSEIMNLTIVVSSLSTFEIYLKILKPSSIDFISIFINGFEIFTRNCKWGSEQIVLNFGGLCSDCRYKRGSQYSSPSHFKDAEALLIRGAF